MRILCLLFVLTCLSADSAAQDEQYPIPPEAVEKPGVPKGRLEGPFQLRSEIFPGTVREYWVYVPAAYDATSPPCLMVVQDGINKARGWKLPTVLDNMIHSGDVPVQLGIFVSPGVVPAVSEDAQPRYNRSFEYDSMGDRYSRFLVDEMLPEVEKTYRFSSDPNDRCIAGSSSGAICAFTAAWERPDQFRRVFSTVGTYVGLRGGNEYPILIRKSEPRPIRVFLQDGSNDLDIYGGSWWNANQSMLTALKYSGYDVRNVWGEGGHNNKHGAAILPQALKWLWSGYPAAVKNVAGKPRRTDLLTPGEAWAVKAKGAGRITCCASCLDGAILFADRGGRRIQKHAIDGTVSTLAELDAPATSLAVNADGVVFACLKSEQRIIKLNQQGDPVVFASVAADCFAVLSEGAGFAIDSARGRLMSITAEGKFSIADESLQRPVALAVSPDKTVLTVTERDSRFCHSYRLTADGAAIHRQEYGWLHATDHLRTGALGAASDKAGRTFVSSAMGIQVLDQLGRVHFIISSPPGGQAGALAFGGKEMDTLFVTSGSRLYSRKLRTTGMYPASPPSKPQRPRL